MHPWKIKVHLASHSAHTFIQCYLFIATVSPVPFQWATDDSWEPIEGRIRHYVLHNTSVGILSLCSGWEHWSVCWSQNNREQSLKKQKMLATCDAQQKKKNAAHKPLHQQKNISNHWQKRATRGVNNWNEAMHHNTRTNHGTTKQDIKSYLGVNQFTIHGGYTVQQVESCHVTAQSQAEW